MNVNGNFSLKLKDKIGVVGVPLYSEDEPPVTGGLVDEYRGFYSYDVSQLINDEWERMTGFGLQNGQDMRGMFLEVFSSQIDEWDGMKPVRFTIKYRDGERNEHTSLCYYINQEFTYDNTVGGTDVLSGILDQI